MQCCLQAFSMPGLASLTLALAFNMPVYHHLHLPLVASFSYLISCTHTWTILKYITLCIYIYIFITHNISPPKHHMSIHHHSLLLSFCIYRYTSVSSYLYGRLPSASSSPPGLELTVMGKTSTCKSPTYSANTSRSILNMLTHTNRKYADIHIPFHTAHLAIR